MYHYSNGVLYFDLHLMRIIDQKETMAKICLNDYSNSLHIEMLGILKNLVIVERNFFKYKEDIRKRQKRMKRIERIDELNIAKRGFMRHNNICRDVQRLIYSFM